MLSNQKHALWEAFLVAAVIFILGIFLGIYFENSRTENINSFYLKSEIAMSDGLALNLVTNLNQSMCPALINASLVFADRVFDEAVLLENYEKTQKINSKTAALHTKYDLLRTFLWVNAMQIKEKCPRSDVSTVVYLYDYNEKDLDKQAEQNVWSKILIDLKEKEGKNVLLIPIARDLNISSLDAILGSYSIKDSPAIILPNKEIIYKPISVEEILKKI